MINPNQWRHLVPPLRKPLGPPRITIILALAGFASFLPNTPALAQTAVSESVRERPRLDYESFGFSFRALLGDKERSGPRKLADQVNVFTGVDIGGGYNSNVLRAPNNEKGSTFTSVTPRVGFHTVWDRHAMNVVLKADARAYASQSSENKVDLAARAGGHYDLANDDVARVMVEAARMQAPRGSSNDAGPNFEPQVFNRYTVAAGFNRGKDEDLRLSANARVSRYDYERVDSLSRDALDSTEYLVNGAAAIVTDGPVDLFIVPGVLVTSYDQSVNSDSVVYDLALGWRADTSALTAASGKIGITRRDFDRSGETDITSLLFESRLLWNATPLITLRSDAYVQTDDAQSDAGVGKIGAGIDFNLDYELFENLVFTSGVSYQNDRFQGIDRTDDTVRYGLGAIYLIGERYFVRGDIGMASRGSDVASEEYDETTIFLRFGIKNCCLGDSGLVDAFAEGVRDVFR
jgi:hypothetical protein